MKGKASKSYPGPASIKRKGPKAIKARGEKRKERQSGATHPS